MRMDSPVSPAIAGSAQYRTAKRPCTAYCPRTCGRSDSDGRGVRDRVKTDPDTGRVRAFLPIPATAVALWLALAGASIAQERLRVVTTTTDLKSLVEAVGGDRVEVTSLVPPNTDPEEYQAKPQDAVRLKDARLVVRVGLDFDLWFDRLLTQAALT